jgi:hypothetical protein
MGMPRLVDCRAIAALAIALEVVGCDGHTSAARRATLATFAGYWWGHDRGLSISRDGRAKESINSGCCFPEIDVWLRFSRPRGSPRFAAATATITAVRIHGHRLYAVRPARVGQRFTLRLRNGVITEPLTGANYCAATIDKCGA